MKKFNLEKDVRKKSSKGITLIALVITIIVLLILAGVAISTLTGNNGLLEKTQYAAEQMEVAKFKDEAGLAYMELYSQNAQNQNYVVSEDDWVSLLQSNYGYTIRQSEGDNCVELNGMYYPISLSGSNIIVGEGTQDVEITPGGGGLGNIVMSSNLGDDVTSSMYGYKVSNYSANGVTDWSLFYKDNSGVYIISDDYISEDLSSYWANADGLVADMNDSTKWTSYVDSGVSGALAYGGPTKAMLENSYKAKHGNDYNLTSSPKDPLYVIESTTRHYGYCLATVDDGSVGQTTIKRNTKIAQRVDSNIISDIGIESNIFLGIKDPGTDDYAKMYYCWSNGQVDSGPIEEPSWGTQEMRSSYPG